MSSLFTPAPEPPTELGRYRILSKRAGIRVSPLQLGAMSIGEAWSGIMGSMSKEDSFKLLDAFEAAGGNFIDTANNYQDEESETFLGEWMEKKQNRDSMVIATKFTTGYNVYKGDVGAKTINHCGNHKRSLHVSLRDSLKKLRTDWIDILYVHWWDWSTSIEELMDSLDAVVKQGKVLYLGVSDTPAYIVAAANTYAIQQGKTPFAIYQGHWNIMTRDMEREIIPMCAHFGMAIAPWNVIGGGKFQSKKQMEERKKNNEGLRKIFGEEQSENEVKISDALEKVANEHGLESPSVIAIAYVMQKAPNVFPIVGGRKVEHLQANIAALKVHLTDKQIEYLESIVPFEPGFPNNMIGIDPHIKNEPNFLLKTVGKIDWLQAEKPIGHE